MTGLTIQPLDRPFGREILGLDISQGVEQSVIDELAGLLMEHQVLLIRNQQLDPGQYATFGRHWTGQTRLDGFSEMQVPGHPDINIVGNVGELFIDDAYRNGAVFWHTDCAAEADPNAITMLYAVFAMETGGETVIADMQAAYRDLDPTVKERIKSLNASHCYAGTRPIAGGREDWEHAVTPVTDSTASVLPEPVDRPLVRHHDVTGVPGLYAPAGSVCAVSGMTWCEADRLMGNLKRHATQAKYCYIHHWRAGDLLMWDNTSTLHYARPIEAATDDHDRRLMYRICPLGLPNRYHRHNNNS